jgi:hypothetical protein
VEKMCQVIRLFICSRQSLADDVGKLTSLAVKLGMEIEEKHTINPEHA